MDFNKEQEIDQKNIEEYSKKCLFFLKSLENLHVDEKKLSHNENYMSDKLAWLLDRTETHKLWLKFTSKFLELTFYPNEKFHLSNASVIREYSLSTNNKTKKIDILFLDLDSKDNIILAIENKYFTSDHTKQIQTYKDFLDKYFSEFSTRRPDGKKYNGKILYLTFNGNNPINYDYKCESQNPAIKCFSWIKDENSIYSILKEINSENSEVKEFVKILESLRAIKIFTEKQKDKYINFKTDFVSLIGLSLKKILNNFDKGLKGYFEYENDKIIHTNYKNKKNLITLSLSLTQNTLQLKIDINKSNFYIPLNIHIDQINHLIYVVCFNIYPIIFKNCITRKNTISLSQRNPFSLNSQQVQLFKKIKAQHNVIRHVEYFQTINERKVCD